MEKLSFELNDASNGALKSGRQRTAAIFLLAALTFAALAWASDPPWKGKAYDQWTDKDLEKIFTDSPWSRVGTVTRTWAALTANEGAARGPAGGTQSGSPMPGGRPGGPGGAMGPSG